MFLLFALLVTVGFFAHLVVPKAALSDPVSGIYRQDLVMTVYLQTVFPDWVFTLIAVVLLAAAMSTLDGLLVALSTITANDLVLNLLSEGRRAKMDRAAQMRFALRSSHAVLVIIAVAAYLINLHPPRLLGVFGQVGVYGLAVAATPPLLAGVLFRHPALPLVWAASMLGLALHFVLYFIGPAVFPGASISFVNPGVTASIATLIGILPLARLWWPSRRIEAIG